MAWLDRLIFLLGGSTVDATVAIVGLSNSGKSTIMTQLKPRVVEMNYLSPTIPGVAFTAKQFHYKSLTFVAFDLDEQKSGFGNPWEDFYKECHGLIFVMDCSDRLNMPAARVQFDKMLMHPSIIDKAIPVLFLANKSDQPGALPGLQCAELFGLTRVRKKPWHISSTDALTGEGLNEALDWFAHQLRKVRRKTGLPYAKSTCDVAL